MKHLFFPILISFLFLFSACSVSHKPVTFSTPFGEIEKDYSMAEVMNVLGNPAHITAGNGREVWWYRLEGNNKIAVHFMNDKVREVKNSKEE